MTYSIITLENTEFHLNYYDIFSAGKEECKEACLTDANCVAALHSTDCFKLKFPLGRNIELAVEDNEIILTDWVYKCYEVGELIKLFDSEEAEKKQLERVVSVGLWCIQSEPALRPSMKNAILMIEGHMDVQVPPFPTSN
ncbi:hypothetical protein AAC387_Pa06g2109 [Persea americana]